MPELRRLEETGTSFTHAIAPSHWTLPSHASILTGCYPWEHGTFRGSSLSLRPDLGTYAERFQRAGYATGSFSANPFLSPLTGLTRGFETAAWGQFSDCFRRFQPRPRPVGRYPETSAAPLEPARWVDHGLSERARSSLRRLTTRLPLPWETAFRAVRRMQSGHPPAETPKVAAWIEPELHRFLGDVPTDRPVFTLVNLLDAHEPYFGVLAGTNSPSDVDWLWAYSGPLDRIDWRDGRKPPTPRDLDRIQRLYRAGVELADQRLGRVLDLFRTHGRFDRLNLIVMGDHGQALGEEGNLYHVRGSVDALLRVPLVIHHRNQNQPEVCGEWVSTKDSIALLADRSSSIASVLEGASAAAPRYTTPPAQGACALVDGSPSAERAPTAGTSAASRRQSVVGFAGNVRLEGDVATATVRRTEGSYLPGKPGAFAQTESPSPEPILDCVLSAIQQVRGLLSVGDTLAQERRLASWGY